MRHYPTPIFDPKKARDPARWYSEGVLDVITIENLTVDCVVGVYPHERHAPQPLVVDLALMLDTREAAKRERLSASVHYGDVAAQVTFLLQSCRFGLLETAAHVLTAVLLAPPAAGERRAQIDEVELTLRKPGALGGHAIPSLKVHRRSGEVSLAREDKPFGYVDVVHETREAGIYRLNIAPGRGIPLHVHRTMREAEMVLSEGLTCQGKPIDVGAVHHWPLEAAHRYDNPTDQYQTILCVDSPPFMESDEIAVEGSPAAVVTERVWPPRRHSA